MTPQSTFADLSAAFAAARAPAAAAALANPERALAFIMVAPQPCEALDALLGLDAPVELPVAA